MLLHLEQLVCYREYTYAKLELTFTPGVDVPFMIDHGTELLLVKPLLVCWYLSKVLLGRALLK
jgi:hypothetical protein